MEYQSAIHAPSHFVPILLIKKQEGKPARVVEHLGTGFFLCPNILITCWHCVADPVPADHEYAIRVEISKGKFQALFLRKIERDQNKTDLATAACQYTPPTQLKLWQQDLLLGEEVWSYGYPYPEFKRGEDSELIHESEGRLLRGYMTRHIFYNHPTLGKTEAYELDMPAPQGMSGAALVRKDTLDVAGVIFGSADVETIEEFSRVDPRTGKREPEIRRVISFAMAYDTDSIGRLQTNLTGNMPLKKILTNLIESRQVDTL
jgi:hypothetical protein